MSETSTAIISTACSQVVKRISDPIAKTITEFVDLAVKLAEVEQKVTTLMATLVADSIKEGLTKDQVYRHLQSEIKAKRDVLKKHLRKSKGVTSLEKYKPYQQIKVHQDYILRTFNAKWTETERAFIAAAPPAEVVDAVAPPPTLNVGQSSEEENVAPRTKYPYVAVNQEPYFNLREAERIEANLTGGEFDPDSDNESASDSKSSESSSEEDPGRRHPSDYDTEDEAVDEELLLRDSDDEEPAPPKRQRAPPRGRQSALPSRKRRSTLASVTTDSELVSALSNLEHYKKVPADPFRETLEQLRRIQTGPNATEGIDASEGWWTEFQTADGKRMGFCMMVLEDAPPAPTAQPALGELWGYSSAEDN